MENTIDFFARTLPQHGFKVTVTHVKEAQPVGQYVPTAVDAAKRASDFVIVDIGDKYGIRWKDGRYERVTGVKLNKLKIAHSWTTDF